MSSAGQEMMKSVKANLSQKSSKLRYFDRKIKTDQEFTAIKNAPKLSPEELKAFSIKFKKGQRKWRIKVWILSFTVSFILFYMIYQIIY